MKRMLFRSLAAAVAALALTTAPAAPALADGVRSEGSCSGPGHWELRVARESPTTLRVRFQVRDVKAGSSWQVFLSDNDVRILAATKRADDDGRFRVRTLTRNRTGRDHVEASAVNGTSGGSCGGSVRL